jgi:hypothetical protein
MLPDSEFIDNPDGVELKEPPENIPKPGKIVAS